MSAASGVVSSLWRVLAAAAALLAVAAPLRAAAPEFLDPEVAFKLTVRPAGERRVEVGFAIAPGYYLYREQLKFAAGDATLGTPVLPPGHIKFDETFQKSVEVYRDDLKVVVPVQQGGARFTLQVTNQGCADKGLCYPPQHRGAEVGLIGLGGDGTATAVSSERIEALMSGVAGGGAPTSTGAPADAVRGVAAMAVEGSVDRALRGGRFWTVVGVFFGAGLLLSLTPCVLPMLPILSSVIVGQGVTSSRSRGFGLAAAYSLGMALVYTAFGVAAGLAGEGLSAALQTPWVLGLFATGLVALALSMFGVYELQLPGAITGRLTGLSQRMTAGRYAGVFAMGGVSALLVSPCVAAPLAGALVYLSQTRDVVIGASALFALAAGMSVPLLALGASAGALLPKAGAWMDDVKRIFGWLLIGVALWTVQSLLPPAAVLAGWGVLALGLASVFLWRPRVLGTNSKQRVGRWSAAALLAAVGGLQFVGAASGASDPLEPLAALRAGAAGMLSGLPFVSIRSSADLDAALRTAGRPVMLDFYADWCVSCKEMDRHTFADPDVRRRAEGALLLRADVTGNNDEDRALLKRFGLFGPPGTLFFDANGHEVRDARVIGFQDGKDFTTTLKRVGL